VLLKIKADIAKEKIIRLVISTSFLIEFNYFKEPGTTSDKFYNFYSTNRIIHEHQLFYRCFLLK